MNSRVKGASGERELAGYLRDRGYNARRGQQYSGANGDADVEGLPGIHIECKRVEQLRLNEWMEQSYNDAYADSIKHGRPMIPVVIHRQNADRSGKQPLKGKWKVTMLLDDFLRLYEGQEGGHND